ncbi:hypothetical protein NM688_g8906 [Phlebia brevispora]|uniref:Uncharacterized protein n=1 Tax=Phlebia brevispora TaxID=194682 RepID=A0ACC1RNI0_9APHY|nr:hypothetical protein NM688_g8906 [Phlebia brevispora]
MMTRSLCLARFHIGVDKNLRVALKRDTPNWRVLNSCPPCCYELENEPLLARGRMFAMDGNNSLKRLLSHGTNDVADNRTFEESDYYLSQDFVSKFAHEVKSRKEASKSANKKAKAPAKVKTDDNEEEEDLDDMELGAPGEGDPTDGGILDNLVKTCVRNWKSAASEEKKKMWAIYSETGIFACACRHGFLLYLCDMVRSGELAKYALAIIAKVLEVCGQRPCGAYDIGCSFASTLLASSLGKEWVRKEGKMIVNAFHGYSHHYACQMVNHPSRIPGMGLEDFETMERVFSSSNGLAPVIRHASAYRRRLFIDVYFQQWDQDKYENLATMLYNNYQQALEIVRKEGKDLVAAMQEHEFSEADLENWEQEEVNYIDGLGEESPYDVHAAAYVDLLESLREAEQEFIKAHETFMSKVPDNYCYLPPSKMTARVLEIVQTSQALDSRSRRLATKVDKLDLRARDMEDKMGIEQRWRPDDDQYQEVMKYSAERKFQRAFNHLHKLVVQRLFELQKLYISGTGYKMRTQLAKSLQSRCRAIRNAVDRYNKLAATLNKPRVDWQKISHYSFLQEFALLNETREDILSCKWTELHIRKAMQQYRHIKRAREEIQRCNVEVRRLHTWILDEAEDMEHTLDELRKTSSPLYGILQDQWTLRRRTNARLLAQINALYDLPGFSGTPSPGCRIGRPPRVAVHTTIAEGDIAASESLDEVDDIIEDEEVVEQLDTLNEHLVLREIFCGTDIDNDALTLDLLTRTPTTPNTSESSYRCHPTMSAPFYTAPEAITSITNKRRFIFGDRHVGGPISINAPLPELPNSSRANTRFPMLVQYDNPAFTPIFQRIQDEVIPLVLEHNTTTIVTWIIRFSVGAGLFNNSIFTCPWYCVAYTEASYTPGIYVDHSDMSAQVDYVTKPYLKSFRRMESFTAAFLFMVSGGVIKYNGTEVSLHGKPPTTATILLRG